ncbi:MAG: transposase [Victivallaceae bacterium]|nr:transposase [Victivallaceae bacterium]
MNQLGKYPRRPQRLETLFASQRPLFYITFNTYKRRNILNNQKCFEAFVKYSEKGKDFGILINNFVIMPDHIHLLAWRNEESCGLKNWIKGLKRVLSIELDKNNNVRPHWQEGFFDHVLRSSESCIEKSEYINKNPVRAGLCSSYKEWPYRGIIDQLVIED